MAVKISAEPQRVPLRQTQTMEEQVDLTGIPSGPLLTIASRCVIRVLPFIGYEFARDVRHSLKYPRAFTRGILPSRHDIERYEERLSETARHAQATSIGSAQAVTHTFRAAQQTLQATRKAVAFCRGNLSSEGEVRSSVEKVAQETCNTYGVVSDACSKSIHFAITGDVTSIRGICASGDHSVDITDVRLGSLFPNSPPPCVADFDFESAMNDVSEIDVPDSAMQTRMQAFLVTRDLLGAYPTICLSMLCGVMIWPGWVGVAVGGLGMASLVGWAAHHQATQDFTVGIRV
jgi:hypothetical protein